MSVKFKWIVALLVVIFVSVIAYSSFQATKVRYRVCLNFHGRVHCAVAEGRTPQEAMQGAHTIDCELLSQNRSELMVCETLEPQSVEAMK
ncbi:MAG TPA: hypothetical protein VNJ52_08265 [Patescibacteria group bacterium]|nr:hypothetical protein [Patescibacteria group bacterium]